MAVGGGGGAGSGRPVVPVTVDVDLAPFKHLIATFENLGPLTKTPIERSLLVMMESIDENFQVGGRPRWVPSQRALATEGGRTLIDEGTLRASIQIGSKDNVYNVEEWHGTLGTTVPYAVYHQEGTKRMVARPFVVVQDEDREDIQSTFAEYFAEHFATVGLQSQSRTKGA